MINRPIVGGNVFFDGAYSSGLDFLLSFSLSLAKAFPFYLFGSPSRVFWTVSPQARGWRRNVCSRGGGALSVVAGFIPIRGSKSGKRPVVEPNAAGSAGSIKNGGTSTPIHDAAAAVRRIYPNPE